MKIAVAGDSAGVGLAKIIAEYLRDKYDVYERAILICGTGIGVQIAANKVPGIRAAQCHDTYSAKRAALSNNAQIITMGARVVGPELAKSICDAFLVEQFDTKGSSANNVNEINVIDKRYR
jgi:ribose 5-phosphate isomerase B